MCQTFHLPQTFDLFKKVIFSQAGLRHNCRLGPRTPTNEISSILDAGTVYGSTPEKQEMLR